MVTLFSTDRKRVLMTGSSPFVGNRTNPIWEGVKFMNGREIENKHDIILFRTKIAVNYDEVDTIVPQMWDCYQPHLTIHVGVSDVSCFVLETQATQDDKHEGVGPSKTLVTQLDVAAICRNFNCNSEDELHAKISSDAGWHEEREQEELLSELRGHKYLCEHIYYTSLWHFPSPSLFVYVPHEKYKPEQLARGLERILELCLKQISNQIDDYSYNDVYGDAGPKLTVVGLDSIFIKPTQQL